MNSNFILLFFPLSSLRLHLLVLVISMEISILYKGNNVVSIVIHIVLSMLWGVGSVGGNRSFRGAET